MVNQLTLPITFTTNERTDRFCLHLILLLKNDCNGIYIETIQLEVDMSTWANSSEVESTDASLKLSADQESTLDCHFRRNKNMHPSDVAILSAETGLPEQQVQVRHSNRESIWKNLLLHSKKRTISETKHFLSDFPKDFRRISSGFR